MATGETTIMFNQDRRQGTLPAGWVAGVTGNGTPKWTVEADPSVRDGTNVLKQSGSGDFPWCGEPCPPPSPMASWRQEFKLHVRPRGPGQAALSSALEGRQQLLCRAERMHWRTMSRCITRQPDAGTMIQYKDAPVAAKDLAYATRGVRGEPYPGRAGRQALH
ncbi:hypothetical protein ACU4GD_31115 [Cupriavidus basilensis]